MRVRAEALEKLVTDDTVRRHSACGTAAEVHARLQAYRAAGLEVPDASDGARGNRRVIFGKLEKEDLKSILDLSWREVAVFAPLVVLTILFGFYPKPVLDMSAASVQQLVNNYASAVTAVKAAALQ